MLFSSFPFVVLVVATLAVYYLRGMGRWQVPLLILASFVFYGWSQPWLTLLLAASCLINTVVSWRVLTLPEAARRARLAWAAGGVAVNLAILASFKYSRLLAGLVVEDLGRLDGPVQWLVTLPLPIGISFFTFQGISLVVDVYRDRRDRVPAGVRPTSFGLHLRDVFFYKAFFPQLVAGPIVKAREFFWQIRAKSVADIDPGLALRCLVTGYFLKMVLADNLKDHTYWIQYPLFLHRSGLDLAAMLFGYSMQIFADFAGYSLIAIGVAALFGYRLPENFNFPYISQSVSEFWRRWHISLSSWLREYLYIPLGGNRHGGVRTYLNLLAVMLLGGLWHGAAWSYLVWGGWHGLALALERPFLGRWWFTTRWWPVAILRMLLVFAFVTLSWLLFKLPAFDQALAFLGAMAGNLDRPPTPKLLLLIALLSAPVIAWHLLHLGPRGAAARTRLRLPAYACMLVAIAFNSGSTTAFIYFQF